MCAWAWVCVCVVCAFVRACVCKLTVHFCSHPVLFWDKSLPKQQRKNSLDKSEKERCLFSRVKIKKNYCSSETGNQRFLPHPGLGLASFPLGLDPTSACMTVVLWRSTANPLQIACSALFCVLVCEWMNVGMQLPEEENKFRKDFFVTHESFKYLFQNPFLQFLHMICAQPLFSNSFLFLF